jgi:hypothetical protein
MQKNPTATGEVNKVKITFTKRRMTSYGGFALLASFFERIGFAQMIEKAMPIEECSRKRAQNQFSFSVNGFIWVEQQSRVKMSQNNRAHGCLPGSSHTPIFFDWGSSYSPAIALATARK